MKPNQLLLILAASLMLLCLLQACGESYAPKPHGYYRFDFPQKEYRSFDSLGCPYSFQYPVYGTLLADCSPGSEPYWFNLEFPAYKATLYLSYKGLDNNLDAMTEDVHRFLYKHSIKADAIEPSEYDHPGRHITGFLYDIGGNAASSVQFYLTDSTRHFLRGSLYFYSTPNRDSLAPLIQFFREDIQHLMETVEFKNANRSSK